MSCATDASWEADIIILSGFALTMKSCSKGKEGNS
jgi:hypothetical protein